MLKQLTNGRILTPEGWLEGGSVLVEDGKIVEVTNSARHIVGAEVIDAKGCDIVPGGIELHIHGGGGRDFMEGTEEAFRTAVDAHMQYGTTAIYPTLSSSTCEMIDERAGQPHYGFALGRPLFQSEKGRSTDARHHPQSRPQGV